ncbi:MAG: diguanylate cyclase domain-containing protein [Aestuariibacter sp.]
MSKNNRSTVLIVDDDYINKEILAHGLKSDYNILLADSGNAALELAEKELPDTILLDIVMPDIDGYEVCRKLKSMRQTQKIPVIFSTSKCTDEDEVLGLTMGASDYITKPFNMALVKARVRNQVQLKKKTDLLEQLASVDGLTEIPNRRYFDDVFEQEWRRAMRNQYSIGVCMLDIDYFKQFNDNYGHTAGDDCLVAVARALSAVSNRAGDFLARYGGEEFVFVWPNCEMTNAVKMAERARAAVEELAVTHEYSEVSSVVTISAGIACISPLQSSVKKDLLDKADEQLYCAKEAGRNQICYDNTD